MRNVRQVLVSFCLLIFAGSVLAQSSGIEIKDLSKPTEGWGDKKMSFKAFNHEDYIKFVVVKTVLKFEGSNAAYQNENRFTAYLEPGYWFEMEPVVTIPGNYGSATIYMEFFDVVDTLDTVLPGQEFMDTSFTIEIKMPESARDWLEKGMIFPPRVDEHPYFDNQFVRIMYAMLAEGKSPAEIAEVTGADPEYVEENFRRMTGNRYLVKEGAKEVPTFPIVLPDEAEQVVKLADKTAERLTAVISENSAGYRAGLDSLIQTGVIQGDSDNVLGAERVLFYEYVVVSTLLLWHDLGSKMITDGSPLTPYTNTDICNAQIRDFMYAVSPDDRYNGHHFYALIRDGGSGRVLFAGHPPKLHCEGNFPAKPGMPAKAIWRNDSDDSPEYFIYNSKTVQPLLDILAKGTDAAIEGVLADLEKISAGYGREKVTRGYRYWFWNLVASRTLDSLIEKKVVVPFKNDNYILGIRGGM